MKEVLQSLIADDLVNGDKIGAGNFYWSFPSRTQQVVLDHGYAVDHEGGGDTGEDREVEGNEREYGEGVRGVADWKGEDGVAG